MSPKNANRHLPPNRYRQAGKNDRVSKMINMDKQYEKIFNPQIVRKNLILSSLYLTAFELLNSSIIERIKTFYTIDVKNGQLVPSQEYLTKIVQNKIDGKENLFLSSCLWLIENNVIDESEFDEINKIKAQRNDIAHRITELIINIDKELNLDLFLKIKKYLTRIENWWIVDFELTLNPEYDNKTVKKENVTSGREILLNHLLSIAFQDENYQSKK